MGIQGQVHRPADHPDDELRREGEHGPVRALPAEDRLQDLGSPEPYDRKGTLGFMA